MLKFITSWGKSSDKRASPPSVASEIEGSGDASNEQQPMELNEQKDEEERKENGGGDCDGEGCEGKECEGQLTDEIKRAQKEAEEVLEALEQQGEDEAVDVTKVPALLKLADMAHTDDPESVAKLREQAQALQSQGKQLDLLLMRALQYSNFIAENQRRSETIMAKTAAREGEEKNGQEEDDAATPTKRKRPSSAQSSSSSAKKRKQKGHARTGSEAQEDVDRAAEKMSRAKAEAKQTFGQPTSLVGGTLKDYQLEGVRWLATLWENGISGILADEMGLGKTIEVIAFIAHLREKGVSGPFLITAPLATVPNWVNEFRKWLPSVNVLLYHGSKAERATLRAERMPVHAQDKPSFPVVVTSYEMCIADRAYLERYSWKFMVVDEGHRIKNRNCRLVRELKQIPSASRLLLTGTPIQNTLEELWSLLNFVNPMIFDDLAVFQSWFGFRNIGKETQVEDIIGQERQEQIVSKLHEILRPFLLRRMKKDVAIEVPPKKEIVLYSHMSLLQREYYSCVQQHRLKEALMQVGIEDAKSVSEINKLMNLRKVCNHPFLFGEPRDEETSEYIGTANPEALVSASGKFKLLSRLLPRLHERGHKVLIFSQMTELLDILQDFVEQYLRYQCRRIDGSVKVHDRQQAIDEFNSDPSIFVFLLSTRAGGLGINLTAADTVIIFDSDWNPTGDAQAQDRCHRIGQTRPVAVYRLITTGSVEIDMMEKQISKRKLERMAIVGGDYSRAGHRRTGGLTLDRLKQLLADDVRSLQRMGGVATASDATVSEDQLSSLTLSTEISDEELDLVLDRDRLFSEVTSAEPLSGEGLMYDVVVDSAEAPSGGILQSVS